MSTTEVHPRGEARGPRWWAELPLIAVVYGLYSGGRLLVAGDTRQAVAHAESLLRLERILHLDPEHVLNSAFTRFSWLGVPACFAYATLHYLVTPGVLIWLWRRHKGHYLFMRTWLMVSTLLGLIGFTLLPTAPPRLLPGAAGFHDTMAQYASFGWWGSDASAPKGMGQLTNQYAAMPSLHVGWALWCGVMLWRYGRTVPARVAAVAYPLLITVVVLGTANHYLLDTVAGVAVMGAGLALTRPARTLVAFTGTLLSRPPGAADAVPTPATVADGAGVPDSAGVADSAGDRAVARAAEVAPLPAGRPAGGQVPGMRHPTENVRPVPGKRR
jgi:hypothetical protein